MTLPKYLHMIIGELAKILRVEPTPSATATLFLTISMNSLQLTNRNFSIVSVG